MKISNESKVGIFTAISITVLILGYNYLKGRDLFTKTKTFYAEFTTLDGLVTSNAVMVHGYRVGQVTDIKVEQEKGIRFIVTIEVQNKIPVPENSIIKIYSSDFFGGKAIELVLGDSPKLADNKSFLTGTMEPGFVDNLNQITLPLRDKVKNILESLDSTLSGPAGDALRLSMTKLPKTIDKINVTIADVDNVISTRLASILDHTNTITSNLAKNNAKINHIIENLSSLSDTLAAANLKQTVERANKAIGELSQTLENINSGKGTLGQLAQNEELYNELKSASHDLDELLKDLKANPKRYVHISVFGGKDKDKNK